MLKKFGTKKRKEKNDCTIEGKKDQPCDSNEFADITSIRFRIKEGS